MSHSTIAHSGFISSLLLFLRTVKTVATVILSSALLFLLGLYVIPVFAEKAPQIFSDQDIQSHLITDGKSLEQEAEHLKLLAEKKTAP